MWYPAPNNSLADLSGPKMAVGVGHSHDAVASTGVTVLQFSGPVTASVSILGQAPGTREAALLDPARTVQQVDAFVLAGGSAFGLSSVDPVITHLAKAGRGFKVGEAAVPIVPAAILFDLNNGGAKPDNLAALYADLGQHAASRWDDHQQIGLVGAGYGATTGARQNKGGLGTASATFSNEAPASLRGHSVGALVAVNAVGSPYYGDTPHFRAAHFECDSEFGGLGLPKNSMTAGQHVHMKTLSQPGQNTTIGAVLTTATLDKAGCHSLAIAGQDGITHAIYPAHTSLDGDLVFGASLGPDERVSSPADLALMQAAATQTMARAIARAVYAASRADP